MAPENANHPRHVVRSIGAILAGLLVIFVLSVGTDQVMHSTGIFPPWFQPMSDSLFVLATVYRSVYSILGAYLTARLAPNRPMRHALILGGVGAVLAAVGAIATWNQGPEFGPKWYALILIVISIPLTWIGGKLRLMQVDAKHS